MVRSGAVEDPQRQAQDRHEADRLGAGPAVVAEHAGRPEVGRCPRGARARVVARTRDACGRRERRAEGERGDPVGGEGGRGGDGGPMRPGRRRAAAVRRRARSVGRTRRRALARARAAGNRRSAVAFPVGQLVGAGHGADVDRARRRRCPRGSSTVAGGPATADDRRAASRDGAGRGSARRSTNGRARARRRGSARLASSRRPSRPAGAAAPHR